MKALHDLAALIVVIFFIVWVFGWFVAAIGAAI